MKKKLVFERFSVSQGAAAEEGAPAPAATRNLNKSVTIDVDLEDFTSITVVSVQRN